MSPSALSGPDLSILVAYLATMIALTWFVARRQRSGEDYFLAGRRMRAVPLGASILANQASAVSLVGAPAFVALREGGGLLWLQYELALPVAMLLGIGWMLPALRSVGGASVYDYIERRFGIGTRRAVAVSFLLSRGLALGVVVYASALVVAEATGVGLMTALVGVGSFSVLYTGFGGIVADIWSDVLQLALLWVGTIAASVYLCTRPGVVAAIPVERLQTLVFEFGPGASTFALGPMMLGGLFLYLSYYCCDQSQAQRLLTAADDRAAGRALALNGLLRFPLVATYCGFGLLLAGLIRSDATFASRLEGRPADSLVPVFLTSYLPTGLRGLMLAAILAAAMSSIDSALNSLAAVTREDILRRDPASQDIWGARLTSMGWGLFAILSATFFARSGSGLLELVNLVGSVFYGPVLGVFTLGLFAPGVTGRFALGALATGLATNAMLAAFAPQVSWLWWNAAGWLAAVATGTLASRSAWRAPRWSASRRAAWILVGAFSAMAALLVAISLQVPSSPLSGR